MKSQIVTKGLGAPILVTRGYGQADFVAPSEVYGTPQSWHILGVRSSAAVLGMATAEVISPAHTSVVTGTGV